MTKYRKKPVVIEATQWFKNGDHPEDFPVLMHDREGRQFSGEGLVVRYLRCPDMFSGEICSLCGHFWEKHGWIAALESEHIVCPGDYIITSAEGEVYPYKPDIFEAIYEPLNQEIDSFIDKWLHIFDHEGNIQYQGHIINKQENYYLIQLLSWLDDYPTRQIPMSVEDLNGCVFYNSTEEMQEAERQYFKENKK